MKAKHKQKPPPKKPRRMPPPDALMAAPPAEDVSMAPAPMFANGGAASDVDMDDEPRAAKRADRRRKR